MSDEPVVRSVLDHQSATRRVFIIHVRLDADPSRGRLWGRIQHTQSNDASHFDSVDELVAFIAGHLDVGPE
jgi:hypothetical protein